MKKKPFLKLTRKEQADVVRPLMEDGGSYGSVAKKFAVGRGRIMGICRDYGIDSKRSAGFEELPKSSSGVVLRLAVIESRQCEAKADGHQCAYVKEPNSRYCALPVHQALEKRRG
ncbi:MAG: hypothetical protein Q7S50_00290 [bacterium]|nr:hypothetical protein [bacterium]